MQTRLFLAAFALAVSASALLAPSAFAAPPAYTFVDLGPIGSDGFTLAAGINASGQVVGNYDATGGVLRAALWTGTTRSDLPSLGGKESVGLSINTSGQVAGRSLLADQTTTHAVRWTGGVPQDLGTLGGTNSAGFGINSAGQIAGTSDITGNASYHAVRWTGTTPQDLGTLGGAYSHARGINDSGQIAGAAEIAGGALRAVRWTGTTPQDLGTLGGTTSEAYDINASGQVVGYAYAAGDMAAHAIIWTGTTPTDLGRLHPTYTYNVAYSINDSGDVLGSSGDPNGSSGLFLYTGGTMYDLQSLLPENSGITGLSIDTTSSGSSLNNLRQIAAFGIIDGEVHALRLSPVPEPASAMLLLGGGAALLGMRRRR